MSQNNKKQQYKKNTEKLKLFDRMKKSIVENDPLKQKKIKDTSKGYRK